MTGARSWPRAGTALVAVLVVVASAAIAYRVLAPAEVVTPARTGYPPAPTVTTGVIGTLNAAPLIVEGRLRVYATVRQVRADQPVDARTRRTPYWSYRRWPAQVAGLMAAGDTVVTRWSDGEVVALDARTGRVRWRAGGPAPDHGYEGRRTGAATVYAPAGLFTASGTDGRRVVIVTGNFASGNSATAASVTGARTTGARTTGALTTEARTTGATGSGTSQWRGIDLDTGAELWRVAVARDCRSEGLSTTGGRFVTVDTCATPQVVEFRDVLTGAAAGRWRPDGAGPAIEVAPVGCADGRSGCPAIRTTSDGAGRGWLVDGAEPVAAPPLDGPETALVGEVAVRSEGAALVGRSVRTRTEAWRRPDLATARILAVQPGRVHLLTEAGELVTLEAASGAELSRFLFTYGRDSTDWSPGYAYAAGGFVAVERLAEPVDPAAEDQRYYLSAQPVILAGT